MSMFGFTVSESDTVIFCLCLLVGLLTATLVEMWYIRKVKVDAALRSVEEAVEMAWATGVKHDELVKLVDEIYNKDKALEQRALQEQEDDSIF